VYALALPHRRAVEAGRRCAAELGRTVSPNGSHLGRRQADFHFHYAFGFLFTNFPTTHTHVRLLGPCFKTGRVGDRPTRRRPRVPLQKHSPADNRSIITSRHQGSEQNGTRLAGPATEPLPRRIGRARVSNASSVGRLSRVEAAITPSFLRFAA